MEDQDVLARQVAEVGWGRREALSPVHLGLNRRTWQVGRDLWLTLRATATVRSCFSERACSVGRCDQPASSLIFGSPFRS